MPDDAFRLGFVPGVTPAKWAATWSKRHQRRLDLIPLDHLGAEHALASAQVDIALLRPEFDRELTSAIPLYEEVAVVLTSRDHLLAALDKGEAATADLVANENFLVPLDDVYPSRAHIPGTVLEYRPTTTKEAVELVATGMGLLIAPMSLARLYHRKDVVFKELTGAPTAPVYLAWRTEHYSDAVEDFIGIVRGRTVNSTRGRGPAGNTGSTSDDASTPKQSNERIKGRSRGKMGGANSPRSTAGKSTSGRGGAPRTGHKGGAKSRVRRRPGGPSSRRRPGGPSSKRGRR